MIYLLLVAILLYSHTMNPGCQRAAVDERIPFDFPQKVSPGVSETPNERDICAPDTVPRNNNFLVELARVLHVLNSWGNLLKFLRNISRVT